MGNPVPLDAEGKATIKYMPMQYYDEDAFLLSQPEADEETYVEYVKAVYNYGNDNYGEQWDYYAQSVTTLHRIYLRRPNYIELSVDNTTDTYTELIEKYDDISPYDYKWNHIKEDSNIIIHGYVYDENGEVSFKTNDEIILNIRGTQVIPNGNIELNTNNVVAYVEENFTYKKINYNVVAKYKNGKFTCDLNANNIYLNPGFYTISAILNTEYGTHNGNTEYLADTCEQIYYYLQVDYSVNHVAKLNFDSIEATIYQPVTIQAYATNLSNDELNALNGKECIFRNIKTKKEYKGLLTKTTNILTATADASINEIFNKADDYQFIAIISGKYISGQENILIQQLTSNISTIKVRKVVTLSIATDITNTYYAGNVKYTAKIENIYQEYIYASIKNKNLDTGTETTIANNLLFNKDITEYRGKIDNKLNAGRYQLSIVTNTQTATVNYEILKSKITQSITDGFNDVISNPTEQMSIQLGSTGTTLKDVNVNNFNIAKKSHDATNFESYIVDKNIKHSDNYSYLTFATGINKPGTWDIKVTYNDSNYETIVASNTFETHNIQPFYTIVDERSLLHIHINSGYPQCIPILIILTDGSDSYKVMGVTNQSGTVSIPIADEYIQDFNTVILSINPMDEKINTSIKNNTTSKLHTVYDSYPLVYYGTTGDNSTQIYNWLRNQLSTYVDRLFIIFNEDKQTKLRDVYSE